MFQGKIFADQEFTKLAEKYEAHAAEERDFQNRFMQRLLDLGADIKIEARGEVELFEDPIEFLKNDYEISKKGVSDVKEIAYAAIKDHTS